mgnify:FL=1|tara:strand:+ start:2311 stop:2841 length:531 start_codon:yes stop_codon:yes gene_type:complete
MGLNILKNISVSLLLLISIGCESDALVGPRTEQEATRIFVDMPYVGSIELNDYSWQTLVTITGDLEAEDQTSSVENFRITWESNMFWLVNDTTGYFRANCRTCSDGVWYGADGAVLPMEYDFHSMAPVTNQVSISNQDGEFSNVLAPVRSMVGESMWLWWSVNDVLVDSMSIYLME